MLQEPKQSSALVSTIEPSPLNLANLLTLFRVILVPPVLIMLYYSSEYGATRQSYTIAAGLMFILAAVTDKLDGYLARRTGQITRLGKFFDPLADKLLMIPVLFMLWWIDPPALPLWVVIVITAREIGVSAIRIYGERHTMSFPASLSGKAKMFVQVSVVSVLIFFPGNASDPAIQAMVYFMVAITAYSGVVYVLRARRELFAAVRGKG